MIVFPNKIELLKFGSRIAEDGLFIEFGVFKGDSITTISKARPNKTIYGFDSFEGLPEEWNGCKIGKFKLDNIPEFQENIIIIPGRFEDTLQEFINVHKGSCAFIHVDCDLYSSTKTILDHLVCKIIPGTLILFDEYDNYPGWELHEYKAFKEYVNKYKIKYECYAIVKDGQQSLMKIL